MPPVDRPPPSGERGGHPHTFHGEHHRDDFSGAIALFVFLCIIFTGLIAASFAIGTRGEETITRQGIPAAAIVLRVSDTGTMINSRPQLRIGPGVRPPAGSRFRTMVLQAVLNSFIPQVQPGRRSGFCTAGIQRKFRWTASDRISFPWNAACRSGLTNQGKLSDI